MPQYYQLPDPNVTAISVDGFEHKVNPTSGLLEVEMLTPNLVNDLVVVRGAILVEPGEVEKYTADRAAAQKVMAEAKAPPPAGKARSG
jgi:hypothetical protein